MGWFVRLAAFCAFLFLFPRLAYTQGTTLIVNSMEDPGDGVCTSVHCTLREAITAANASPGRDTITFALPGAGPYVIRPTFPLPAITDAVIIDGTTQPGYPGAPIVELDGSLAGYPVNGLWLLAGNSTVRGLLVHSFTGAGMLLQAGSGSTIAGNYIGTDVTGSVRLGNRDGIYLLNSSNNVIGGTTAADRNLISGNNDDGVNPNGATGNRIQGNIIGLSLTGQPLGNAGDGIKIGVASGSSTIVANTIAANGWRGVFVESGATSPTGVHVTQNQIYGNGALGIDLGGDNVTANDAGDADSGPNTYQNFPQIVMAETSGGSLVLNGILDSEPGSRYRIEFFQNPVCDLSGNGEGQFYLGATDVTTAAEGTVTFSVWLTGVFQGAMITATATDANGNTSEFSACVPVNSIAPPPAEPGSAPLRNLVRTGTPTLTWSTVTWATAYQIQVDDDARFGSPNVDITVPGSALELTIPADRALGDGVYFWRVRAMNASSAAGRWSAAEQIIINAP
ncbi:MAG: right-handed parallel beta-helix repeat-containing protein [Chloroflexi bacterium]|nr:right-handed parallel beta-helix repeat-containing protein [Chloroflexota bacterium]